MIEDVKQGNGCHIPFPDLCNLYGCELGDWVMVGPFVEIQRGVTIGRWSKIESHAFICELVTIEENVFVGHGAKFCNDKYPYINNGPPALEPITVRRGATIGTNATILPGVTIGEFAIIGAGAVVTKDVEPYTVVAGNPARVLRKVMANA